MPSRQAESARIRGHIVSVSELVASSLRTQPILMILRTATVRSVRLTFEVSIYVRRRNATYRVIRMATRSVTEKQTATAEVAAMIIRNSNLRGPCHGRVNYRIKKCLPIQLLIRITMKKRLWREFKYAVRVLGLWNRSFLLSQSRIFDLVQVSQ